jgi:protein TonB
VLTAQGAPNVIGDGRITPPPPVTFIPVTPASSGEVQRSQRTAHPCVCLPVPALNFQGKIPLTNVDIVDDVPDVPSGTSFWADTLAPLGGSTIDTGRAGEPWSVSETSARVLRASRPRYPESLRAAGVDGRVVVRFIIDTAGRVESTTVLHSSHHLFTRAVLDVLPSMRLIPAEVGGRRVPMLAEMAFEFALDRR